MSIVIAVLQPNLRFLLLFWSAVSVVVLAASAWLHVIRPARVDGPLRVDFNQPLWHLFFVMLAGFFIWFSVQVLYGFARATQHALAGGATRADQFDESMFTAFDWAFLATVPALAATFTLLAGDLLVGRSRSSGKNASWSQLGLLAPLRGLGLGLVGIVVVFPVIQLILGICEWFYQRVGYVHPMEHDLLRVIGESHSIVLKVALFIGATMVAPLFEELLFRGHIQTLIRAYFLRRTKLRWMGQNVGAAIPFAAAADASLSATTESTICLPSHDESMPSSLWQSWMAIVIASVLFALVHPRWMQAPIFCLSVALGYAYERTRNLWASITMHASFNLVSTLLYLLMVR